MFPGVAMLVAMAVWFFRKRRVVKIYLDNRESFSKDNIYYSSVNKKYFLQKMKEWHVELEDNKPEERTNLVCRHGWLTLGQRQL